jgi:tetratricopeptide (TPR) repeat protein
MPTHPTDVHPRELDHPAPTPEAATALRRCRAAEDLVRRGQHEAAREALGGLWRGVGVRPDVAGLDEGTAAEVLLQVGALSGRLGASRRVQGAQAAAKELLGESAALFEMLGRGARAALARSDLALCCWREGSYEEARQLYAQAFDELGDAAQRARVLLRRVTVECSAKRYDDALLLLKRHAQLFGEGAGHDLRGSFHAHTALVLRHLGTGAGNAGYFDRAIIEYTAAIFHYEQAPHERHLASNENNLALLLYRLGRHADAHEHLDRAQAILTRLKDLGALAQVDETRARVFAAEGRHRDAERVLAAAVKTLERGDESARLAEALTVQGVVMARLCDYEGSLGVLRRAAALAETAGAPAGAAQALLALIEEHGATPRLRPDEVYDAYVRADGLLGETQDAEEAARLRACALVTMKRLKIPQVGDEGFTLPDVLREFEARFIERALGESGGSLVAAARLLGITHQTLNSVLNTRHRRLSARRKPPQKRRKVTAKSPRK